MTGSIPRLELAVLAVLAAVWLAMWISLPLPGVLAGLALWGAACARCPRLWLFLLPTLLAVVDTAPWTGWFFFDLSDLMLLVALAVELARRGTLWPVPVSGFAWLAIAAFVASLLLSLLFGAGADPAALIRPPGPNGLFDYLSPWNGLRVAIGFFWAMALLPVLGRLTRDDPRAPAWLVVNPSTNCGCGLRFRVRPSGRPQTRPGPIRGSGTDIRPSAGTL